jgi:trigger factor
VVTDADIDKMLETLRQQRRSFDEVDRASAEGDFVMFEYAAEAGDYRFPAEGLERAGSVLGSGTLFKALDEALTSRKADDLFDADVTFPEDFRNEQLAGKTAKVSFKIIKVQAPKLPEIDGEFAKLFGIADGDLETFRKEVRANLERELKAALMARLKSEVAEKLAGVHAELDVPKLLVQSEARNMAAGSVPQGQQPPPQLIDAAMPMARKRVIAGLLMGEIARKQEIKIDRKRVAEQLAAIASTYEEPEKVIELYNGDPQLMSGLQNRVMEDQVAEWVAEHANTAQQDLSFDDVMRPAGT